MEDQDHFKVVFIKETDEVEPVPHAWECDGILYWPPSKSLVRLNQSNVKSVPDYNTWTKYTCVVKAQGLLLFNHASSTADRYCASSAECSTDDEKIGSDKYRDRCKPRKIKAPERYSSYFKPEDNLSNDSLVQVINVDQTTNSATENSKSIQENQNEESREEYLPENGDNTLTTDLATDEGIHLISDIELIKQFDKLNDFLKEWKNQSEVMLGDLAIKVERLEEKIMKNTSTAENYDSNELQMFPIGKVGDLLQFEKDLLNHDYKKKVFYHLRRITGSGTPWKTACYKLCATILTKDLLTKFSWTGMSRSHEKQAFCKLSNILDLFYKVIHLSDSSFTYPQRDAFFRDCVLKHSNTRLHGQKKKNRLEPEVDPENEEGDNVNITLNEKTDESSTSSV